MRRRYVAYSDDVEMIEPGEGETFDDRPVGPLILPRNTLFL